MVHDVADDVDHLGEPFHGVVFALDGHEDFGARCQGCLGQLPERGWGVDDHRIVDPGLGIEVLLEQVPATLGPFFQQIDVLKAPATGQNLQRFEGRAADRIPKRLVAQQGMSLDRGQA